MATPTDPGAPSGPPDPPNVPAPAPLGPLPASTAVIGAVQITDAGLTRIATVKAGSTAAAAVDPSLVVALSPNSPIPAGANAIGSVSLNTALPSGNNNIGDVDIVTMPGLLTADVTIKAASTASVAGDKSLVTALSPNTPLPVGANAIGSVAINAALPAGTNLLGKIEVANQKTIKTLKIDANTAGETVLVALVAGKRIKVIAYTLQAKGTVDVKLVNGAAGTDLTGAYSFQAREGIALATDAPSFLMATTAGLALVLNLSAAIQVVGFVTYFDDDAT